MFKRRMAWVPAVMVVAALVVAGAVVAFPGAGKNTAEGEAAAPKKVDLPPEAPVVVVNGTAISKAEFDRALSAYMRQFQQATGSMHGGVQEPNEQMRRDILDQLVDRELLYQVSVKHPVADREQRVQQAYDTVRERFPDEATFQSTLSQEGLDEAALRVLLERQVVVRDYVEAEIQPGVAVTDADVRKFYDDNIDKFTEPEQVKCSHILIRAGQDASEEEKGAARAKAEALRARCVAGEDFAELAKENSEDTGSAPKGGDVGFFTRERMVPEFADAAFGLEVNSISDVVESPFGYHVIKVTDRKAAGSKGFEEVEGDIRNYLMSRGVNEAVQTKVAELRKDATVDIVQPHF